MSKTKSLTSKKSTGVKFTPEEFRELNQCVFCGKAEKIPYGGQCAKCILVEYLKCEVCGVVLRDGLSTYYTYDTRDVHRDAVSFNPIKEPVREFIYQRPPLTQKHSNTLCVGCIGWEENVKDNCIKCACEIINSRDNYKINGNVCPKCNE